MSSQTIRVPGVCPDCGGQVCVHDLGAPWGIVHCHDRETESECGWAQRFPIDPEATSYVIVATPADDEAAP